SPATADRWRPATIRNTPSSGRIGRRPIRACRSFRSRTPREPARAPRPRERTMTHRTAAAVLLAAIVFAATASTERLPQDVGAAGTWQKLLKLQTTASAMHTTAHPDDEHGGVLAWLSRGVGARLSLLTLNRGESGDNAIGSELFDGVGLIRTEELRDAGRYY